MTREASKAEQFAVVVNGEGQYSLWQSERPLPAGWQAIGGSGTRAECLARISTLWTDIRPHQSDAANQ